MKLANILLGVDPGLAKTGWGVIDRSTTKYIDSGIIKTLPATPHPERLLILASGVQEVISKYKPDVVCVERVFINTNFKSSLLLCEARGAILASILLSGVKVVEMTALQIKLSVAGRGRADKSDVASVVSKTLHIDTTKMQSDITDALACAIAATPLTQLIPPTAVKRGRHLVRARQRKTFARMLSRSRVL